MGEALHRYAMIPKAFEMTALMHRLRKRPIMTPQDMFHYSYMYYRLRHTTRISIIIYTALLEKFPQGGIDELIVGTAVTLEPGGVGASVIAMHVV